MAVDFCVMRFPSASVCIVSVTACAEYGAPFTGDPPINCSEMNPNAALPPVTTFVCAKTPATGSCAWTATSAAKMIMITVRVFIFVAPLLFRLELHESNRARQSFFPDQYICLDRIGQAFGMNR